MRAPFRDRAAFAPTAPYRLLPFRFTKLDGNRYLATNEVGEYVVLPRATLEAFARHELSSDTVEYSRLEARHFLFRDDARAGLELLAAKVRTRAAPVAELTGLHIFVVTLRCDHSCHYCQVSRQTEDRASYDMRPEHADLALDRVLESPGRYLKLEFQGGEPLLNFELIRRIVTRAEAANRTLGKVLQFVIASNLTHVSDEILAFCREHDVHFSTSLDGPADLHDARRPLRGGSSHGAAVSGVERVRAALGSDRVSALMTTSPESLPRVTDIIDEYVRLGFRSIFLRSLSPFGFAVRTSLVRSYSIDDWLEFYRRGLDYILELARRGVPIREELTSILLQKMFSPTGPHYVDLQSPAGLGIGALVYNYDGRVFASDEGRMLAEMGNDAFCLGTVDESLAALLTKDALLDVLEASLPESAPMCADCAFLPFCGADPVFHAATARDPVGHKAFSAFCKKQMGVLRHVIGLLEDDAAAREILMGWVA
ncbi:MAG TPA: His-Xaa-Ser system radical SAM maturase HxsB [Kofleriaceae bacterium]